MSSPFIYDHVRTPRGRGKPDGALHEATSVHLAATVLSALRERTGLDTRQVEDIVFGVVAPVGEQGQCLPRVAALQAGYAQEAAGVQINRFCGSGLEACNMAASKVHAGAEGFVIGGGAESMSRVPMFSDGGAWSVDPVTAFASNFIPQGISADLLATMWNYSREEVDGFAVRSHRLAAQAWAEGRFDRSVVPVRGVLNEVLLAKDETVRPNCTPADLAGLKPSFAELGRKGGFDALAIQRYPTVETIRHVHHAGNSSGIVDGACAVLIGSEAAGRAAGLTPRARIRAFAEIGSEPTIMLTAPSFAAERALRRAGMSASDIDLYEINEAFAAVALRFIDALGLDDGKVNVNGGAIAMGHPLGATGAMILGTALDELERTGKGTALVTLCIGAGMGVATIIERI
ncbi:acetyl-CoA C-acetyltransferase family protein [Paraburkholderia xenovorans LB400]|uniref:Thiolase n=1 Tax=Paraburkholderia xenovorans (strain LB400) TaxID=266265 RepID=Q13I85_PARXL|nr:acetyl-CoA C-acetyltransferase [Paraburkholderia xenovorans]ABE36204.1 Thiolase [Paraburkholderia xenovorans LB400]AIP33991.1 acetyl-CoA C-acetyltransferase family protein [Paraburkholderia xenovorans LB400]